MAHSVSEPTTDGGAGLRRQVTLGQLVAYGLVFVGPAAAVSVFGALDAHSGGVVPLVYLVATIAMAFTAASYVLMSWEVPRAGSVFAYAGAGIGPRAGFVAGWMVMLDYLLIPVSRTCSPASRCTRSSRPSPSGCGPPRRSCSRRDSTSRG